MNNIPSNFWSVLKGLAAILIVFVIVLCFGAFKVMSNIGTNPNNQGTISVDGTGDVVSVPDIATFSFTVSDTEKTVADAQAKATTKINAALKAVRDQGIADKDISTQSYTINPHYEYQTVACSTTYCPGGKSVLTGYEVSESIQVKVRDLTKAGTIFTAVGTMGVENVNGLQFSVDDPSKVQADARSKAINDAKAKAQVLADQLGVRLVRIVSYSENGGGYVRPMMYAMDKVASAGAVAPVPPEVPVGEQKVTSTVSITYEIR